MMRQKLALFVALTGLLVSVQPAAAQQISRDGYNFPARNSSLSAQFQFQQRMAKENAGGLGALNQFITTYSSNSTSIGNMNTITQILSEGSTGTVGQATDQTSTGNQGSEAKTDTQTDNSIVSTESISPASQESDETLTAE